MVQIYNVHFIIANFLRFFKNYYKKFYNNI